MSDEGPLYFLTRKQIDTIINGGTTTVEPPGFGEPIQLQLCENEMPKPPEGFTLKNIVVTSIEHCDHIDGGWCLHPEKGIVHQYCNLDNCPIMDSMKEGLKCPGCGLKSVNIEDRICSQCGMELRP